MKRPTAIHGFTLIEMMVAVAIIGILATAAIPALTKYVKKSKTTEAKVNLRRISEGARSYYYDSAGRKDGMGQIKAQFPDTPTPIFADPDCCAMGGLNEICVPHPGQWVQPPWRELHFSIEENHRYAYQYNGAPTAYTAVAYGDLDCDGQIALFFVSGLIDSQYADGPTGGPIRSVQPLE